VASVTPSGSTGTGPTSFTVTFTENIGLNAGIVQSLANYRLVSSANGVFGDADDVDQSSRITSVVYNPATKTATIALGGALPAGNWRLSILPGILDQAGNALGNGAAFQSTLTVDATPPAVLASSYTYLTRPHVLTFQFSENVSASLSAADLVVVNLTTGQTIPSSAFTLVYNGVSNTATFTYTGTAGLAPGVLPDGRYTATLLASGVTDGSGNLLDGNGDGSAGGDAKLSFFFMAGDANHDAAVDFNDLVKLAQNYNTTGGKQLALGDFNYDGNVDFNDLVALAQRYNTSLPPAGSPAAPLASPSPVPSIESVLAAVSAQSTPAPTAAPKPTPKPTPKPAPASSAARAKAAVAPRPVVQPAPTRTPKKAFSTRAIGNAPADTGLGQALPGKVSVRFASGPGSDPVAPAPIFGARPMPPRSLTRDYLETPYSVLSPVSRSKVFSLKGAPAGPKRR
jgi:hypothetical protein